MRLNLFIFIVAIALAVPYRAAAVELPVADRVVVIKSERVMLLMNRGDVMAAYRVAVGKNPDGPKQMKGDNRTPEGTYFVKDRIMNSRFHLALELSYPNATDQARARQMGVSPGGDIMIHGLPSEYDYLGKYHATTNWTNGCIAVTNGEMEEIWQHVPDGTPVEIRP